MKKGTALTITLLVIGILIDITGFFSLFTYAATPAYQLKLGQKYLDIGSYTEAILAFNKVITISPGTADAYIGLSKAYTAKSNPQKAAEVLEQGLERTGDEGIRRELNYIKPETRQQEEQSTEEATPLVIPPPLSEGVGILSGRVSTFGGSNNQSVAGAEILVYSNGTLVETITADPNGNFSASLDSGVYSVVISANGYHTLMSEQKVAGNDTTYAQHFLLIDQREVGTGTVGGIIADAATGRGISGVAVRLYPNWNNANTDDSGGRIELLTDSNGYYEVDVPVGYYTAHVTKGDYISASYNVISVSGAPDRNQNIVITQSVQMDQIRIVLRWGETPSDLDSHLVVPLPDGTKREVFYSNKVVSYSGVELSNLDVDDTTSYGPETVTILKFDESAEYAYYVHDYSNGSSSTSTQLGFSGATVSVYIGDSLYDEYSVPVGQPGCYWHVFTLDRNGIHPINSILTSNSSIIQ